MKRFGFFFEYRKTSDDSKNYSVKNFMNDKFKEDKIFYDSPDYLILLDGVILNKKEIMLKNQEENWYNTIIELYIKENDTFFKALRGSFCGILYDKRKEKILVFSDQLGTKFLYYYDDLNTFICSTHISDIYQYLRENNISYKLDNTGAYLLLSYGFMIGNKTLCEKIKKIEPGHYVLINNKSLSEHEYYFLNNTPTQISEEEAIDLVDNSFRRAVKEEFEKDKEYNYKHFVALSGGLDSRMTCWVAHELGYIDQINYTFAQTGSLDQQVPQQITSDLKHDWIFKNLDNGLWLYNIEEITKTTGGNVLYYGLSHSYSMYERIDFKDLGIIHTGQLGDVVVATHTKNINESFLLGDGAYSRTFIDKLSNLSVKQMPNKEIGCYYYRYLPGTNNGNMSEYSFSEMFSPFYNLDFIEKVLSIPVEYRFNHKLYKKWILKKYPDAANYIWTGLQTKINAKTITLKGHEFPISKIPSKIMSVLLGERGLYNKRNMNPIGYYIRTNRELKEFLYSYFDYVDVIEDSDLKDVLNKMKKSENPFEIIEAVSLLASIKLFFNK